MLFSRSVNLNIVTRVAIKYITSEEQFLFTVFLKKNLGPQNDLGIDSFYFLITVFLIIFQQSYHRFPICLLCENRNLLPKIFSIFYNNKIILHWVGGYFQVKQVSFSYISILSDPLVKICPEEIGWTRYFLITL